MSDTPRTDAALVDHMPETSEWSQCYLDLTIHARQLERELNAAVRRMNDVPAEAIEDAYWSSWKPYQNIRNLFIQAAKGEQPCATHREQMNLF